MAAMMVEQINEEFLTPAEVAHLLGVAPVTVRAWASKGLCADRITPGGHRRFARHEVERFARKRGIPFAPGAEVAGVVRAVAEHSMLYDGGKRLYYMGPMFRHERPQRGRYRQFHQIGAEALGFPGAELDAELILLANALW